MSSFFSTFLEKLILHNNLTKKMMFKKHQIIFILFCGTYCFSQTAMESESQNYTNLTSGAIYPYQFSITTLTSEMPKWNFSYSSSYGERVNGPFGYDGVGQQFSIKGYLGNRFTLHGNATLGITDGQTINNAQQLEVIHDIIGGKENLGFRMGVGLGARRDFESEAALFSRLTASFDQLYWRLGGNLIFEKAFGTNKDAIDVITSIGFQYRVLETLFAGVELVGQDLEGFWEEDEAEGGAQILFGPSLNFSPKNSKFIFSVTGGPVIYATRSELPPSNMDENFSLENGYSIRGVLTFNLSNYKKS
jgi:hypothetical protein